MKYIQVQRLIYTNNIIDIFGRNLKKFPSEKNTTYITLLALHWVWAECIYT